MTSPINDHVGISTRWRFVCQTRSGTSYLHLLELLPDDTGAMVLEKLRKEYYRVKMQHPYTTWDRIHCFWEPVLEVVTISEVSLPLELSPFYFLQKFTHIL
jgi:hypothetical protein